MESDNPLWRWVRRLLDQDPNDRDLSLRTDRGSKARQLSTARLICKLGIQRANHSDTLAWPFSCAHSHLHVAAMFQPPPYSLESCQGPLPDSNSGLQVTYVHVLIVFGSYRAVQCIIRDLFSISSRLNIQSWLPSRVSTNPINHPDTTLYSE